MTKTQYLEARISEINSELSKKHLPPKYRRNQLYALAMYKNDLEREKALNRFN